jgi:hypothetical protein
MPRTIAFETELTGGPALALPPEVASVLPSQGKATVVVFTDMDPEDAEWRRAAYERFLSDDSEDEGRDGYGCRSTGEAMADA